MLKGSMGDRTMGMWVLDLGEEKVQRPLVTRSRLFCLQVSLWGGGELELSGSWRIGGAGRV